MTDGKNQTGQRYAPAPAQPTLASVRGNASTACRSCQHRNPDGATFCEECGQALAEPVRCANCQSVTHPGADICEACGTWLLSGQCMFCYAPVLDGESFCAQCGNPAGGLICPQCAQPSIFDFCKSCGMALSEQARSAIAQVAQDPGMQAFAGLASSLAALSATPDSKPLASVPGVGPSVPGVVPSAPRDAAASLRAYRDSIRDDTPAAPVRKASSGVLSETQKANIGQLNDAIAEETRRREEEAERQRVEAERQRLDAQRRQAQALQRQRELRDQLLAELRALGSKTFWTHQEARRFAMALLANLPPELLAELKRSGLGWRCNAYNCIHDAPNECADPSKGGVWLLR